MRLTWLFGEQIAWELHMVGLSDAARDDDGLLTRQSAVMRDLQQRHGMPIDWRPRRYAHASVHACRAVVAVRLRWPEHEDAYLRALRVLTMGGMYLDDSDTLEIAAERCGLPVEELASYAAEPEVQAALEEDMAAARTPTPAALAQSERLGGADGELRYSCPSYRMHRLAPLPDGEPCIERLDLPGFRAIAGYIAALANLAPDLERREQPGSVADVLEWAPYPLATAEVAAVCDREPAEVRLELAASGAAFAPVGADGYWSPT